MSRSRKPALFAFLAIALLVCGPLTAQEPSPSPENLVGMMSTKFLRGLVNVVTCPLELPRQISRQVHRRGAWEGSCVGFVAGLGMTVFRCAAGGLETALFLVPEPGYYDPLMTPTFAWEDWGAPVLE